MASKGRHRSLSADSAPDDADSPTYTPKPKVRPDFGHTIGADEVEKIYTGDSKSDNAPTEHEATGRTAFDFLSRYADKEHVILPAIGLASFAIYAFSGQIKATADLLPALITWVLVGGVWLFLSRRSDAGL